MDFGIEQKYRAWNTSFMSIFVYLFVNVHIIVNVSTSVCPPPASLCQFQLGFRCVHYCVIFIRLLDMFPSWHFPCASYNYVHEFAILQPFYSYFVFASVWHLVSLFVLATPPLSSLLPLPLRWLLRSRWVP